MSFQQSDIVALVNAYHQYSQGEEGGIEGFCRHYLASLEVEPKAVSADICKAVNENPTFHDDHVSKGLDDSLLGMRFGRISRFAKAESYRRLPQIGLDSFEDVLMIALIGQMEHPTKKEIIDQSMIEYTTGIEVLKRLQKRKLTTESINLDDKRSKRVTLTQKGMKAHLESHEILKGLSAHMFFPLSAEDKQLLSHIFHKLDEWHTKLRNHEVSVDEI